QVGALAAQQVAHVGLAFRLAVTECVDPLCHCSNSLAFMAGLDPAIHAAIVLVRWMAGSEAGHDMGVFNLQFSKSRQPGAAWRAGRIKDSTGFPVPACRRHSLSHRQRTHPPARAKLPSVAWRLQSLPSPAPPRLYLLPVSKPQIAFSRQIPTAT